MKKVISACAALALTAMLAAVPSVSAADAAPKLIAHYEFKDGSVGKDSAGSGDMKVVKEDGQTATDAKVVSGPKGMSALEFDASYALITDKKDVLDPLKEYTVSFLVSPSDAGNLLSQPARPTGTPRSTRVRSSCSTRKPATPKSVFTAVRRPRPTAPSLPRINLRTTTARRASRNSRSAAPKPNPINMKKAFGTVWC